MKRKQILPSGYSRINGPIGFGVRSGNMIFTTQIGTDRKGNIVPGGIKEQTKALMENANKVLEAEGATFDDVAKVTIFVTDMGLVPEMNEVYGSYFPAGDYPARCCTQCAAMVKGALVEIEFTAIL